MATLEGEDKNTNVISTIIVHSYSYSVNHSSKLMLKYCHLSPCKTRIRSTLFEPSEYLRLNHLVHCYHIIIIRGSYWFEIWCGVSSSYNSKILGKMYWRRIIFLNDVIKFAKFSLKSNCPYLLKDKPLYVENTWFSWLKSKIRKSKINFY